MKSIYKFLPLALMTLLLCNSCLEKVIEFDGASIPPKRLVVKMAINGTHLPGVRDSSEIEVSHSRFRFDPQPIQPIGKDLRIRLYGNGQLREEITVPQYKKVENGYDTPLQIPVFYSYHPFKPGDRVQMEMLHPDYPLVKAEGVMPDQAQIINYRFNPNNEILDQTTDNYNSLKVEVKNPSAELCYFRISYRIRDLDDNNPWGSNGLSYIWKEGKIHVQEEPIFEENIDLIGQGSIWEHGIYIFTNAHFSKESSYTLNLYVPAEQKNSSGTHYVVLEQITRDSYLYYGSILKKKQANDDFFAEPVNVYNGMEGGIGILHLKTKASVQLFNQ